MTFRQVSDMNNRIVLRGYKRWCKKIVSAFSGKDAEHSLRSLGDKLVMVSRFVKVIGTGNNI